MSERFWPTGVPMSGSSRRRVREGSEDGPSSMDEIKLAASRRQELVDSLLELSSLMYFGTPDPFAEILRDRQVPTKQSNTVIEDAMRDAATASSTSSKMKKEARRESAFTPLDVLLSSIREPEVIDDWTPYECAVFEAGLIKHGREGLEKTLHSSLPQKTQQQIKDFLDYVYKNTSRYAIS